jgi:hypothetical protein
MDALCRLYAANKPSALPAIIIDEKSRMDFGKQVVATRDCDGRWYGGKYVQLFYLRMLLHECGKEVSVDHSEFFEIATLAEEIDVWSLACERDLINGEPLVYPCGQ